MLNHSKFRQDIIKILNEPNAHDDGDADGEKEWGWTLNSNDPTRTQSYNFEVTIEKEGRINLVVYNNHEAVEVCSLENTTEARVVEKAKTLRSKVWG